MGFPRSVLLALAILLLAGTQARANTSRLQDALQTCALVPNPTDRLTCFDGLAKSTASDTADNGRYQRARDRLRATRCKKRKAASG